MEWGGGGLRAGKETEGVPWGAGDASYLDLGDGSPGAHICKNPPSHTLKICVITCELYVSFKKLKPYYFF